MEISNIPSIPFVEENQQNNDKIQPLLPESYSQPTIPPIQQNNYPPNQDQEFSSPEPTGMVTPKTTPAMFRGVFNPVY